jgi:hypothetical protein
VEAAKEAGYPIDAFGYGLQNAFDISRQWMESMEEYLNKYTPL